MPIYIYIYYDIYLRIFSRIVEARDMTGTWHAVLITEALHDCKKEYITTAWLPIYADAQAYVWRSIYIYMYMTSEHCIYVTSEHLYRAWKYEFSLPQSLRRSAS